MSTKKELKGKAAKAVKATKKYVALREIKLSNGKVIKKGGTIELSYAGADYHKSIKNI